jgi:hypothetical protein
MHAPIFIVGANRSGTTLLRLILNAHSAVAIPDEINYFYSFRGGIGYPRWQAPMLTPEEYADFVDDFLRVNRSATPGLDLRALRADILAPPPDLRRPYQLLLEGWARHHGKSRWGEKTPGNLFYAHHILSMFPDALFVYLVRDPRAVVHSMQRVSFFPDDVVFNALNLRKSLAEGQAHLTESVPAAQRIAVRYEDLVTDPVPTVRRICAFAGLTYEPDMLAYHEDAAQYMTDAASTSFNAAATRPISTARAHAWSRALPAEEVAVVERITRDSMAAFGYEPQASRVPLRRWPDLALKSAYWRYHHWRNRHIPQYVVRHSFLEGLRHRIQRWTRHLRRRLKTLLPL